MIIDMHAMDCVLGNKQAKPKVGDPSIVPIPYIY